MKIDITHYQIKALLDLSEGSGDPECYDDMTLIVMDESGHSGAGLYAAFQEVPEEGYTFLGADEENQAQGDAICEAKIASGEVKEL